MAWPTLLDCRLRELRRNHCATAGQAQTRTYPGQRSSTGSCVPYRFRLDTGPCVGTGGGLAKSGKEIQDSKASTWATRSGRSLISRRPLVLWVSIPHWQIITESESIKEPRGRSRSQSYSQIALLHSHLFLHDQLTFADISGTDSTLAIFLTESP